MSTSARPLSLPARLTLLILPCTYVPAGITMRSFITTGKVVCAYTGSPSRAFLVESACFSTRGTLVPDGMISLLEVAGVRSGSVWPQRRSLLSRRKGCQEDHREHGAHKHSPQRWAQVLRMMQPECQKVIGQAETPPTGRTLYSKNSAPYL